MKDFIYYSISGVIMLFIASFIFYYIPFEGWNVDTTIIYSTIELVIISVFLLASNRIIKGDFFLEKGSIKEAIYLISSYSLLETYFKVQGIEVKGLEALNLYVQRIIFSYWGQIPIPSTLIIMIFIGALLGFSSRSKSLFFFTGLPLSLLILVYFNYWIF